MFRVLGLVLCSCLVGPAAQAATVFATDRVVFEAPHKVKDPNAVVGGRTPDAMLPHGPALRTGIAGVVAFSAPVSLALVGAGQAVLRNGDAQIASRSAAFFEASARNESRAALLWSLGLGALALVAPAPKEPEDALKSAVADVPLPASFLFLMAGVWGLVGLERLKRA